nr:TadE/TadG family type IV pilus assembly protein [Acidisphaera sp. L21]
MPKLGRRGTTTVEMAIIGPAFMLMLMLTLELGYQLTIDMALNIGVGAGSRYGITGQGSADGSRDSTILSTATSITSGLIDPTQLTVTMASYLTPAAFASSGTKATTTGASSNFVVYTYSYKAYFITGFPAAILGTTYLTHTATVVVQNEPF